MKSKPIILGKILIQPGRDVIDIIVNDLDMVTIMVEIPAISKLSFVNDICTTIKDTHYLGGGAGNVDNTYI